MAAPRKEDVRRLIIVTARRMLQEKAFSDMTLSQIAAEAGISKGTLYYHFKTREDILFAVMDDYLDRQKKDLDKWIGNKEKDTSLPRVLKYILERDTDGADMRFQFFSEAVNGNETIREKLLTRYRAFASLISGIIAERTDSVDADYLAWFVLMLSDGILIHKLIGNKSVNAKSFIKETEGYAKLLMPDEGKENKQ